MFKSFILSYKLKNTYRVNSIIYSIKQLPLIGKKLPTSLYASKGLKIFGNVISTILEILNIFLGKASNLIYLAPDSYIFFSNSKNNIWAIIRLADISLTSSPKKTILSDSNREKIS